MLSNRSLALIAVVLAWPFVSFLAAVVVSQPLLGHAAIAVWLPALHFGLVASLIQMILLVMLPAVRSVSLVACFIIGGVAAISSYVELCFFFGETLYPIADYIAVVVAACGVVVPGLVFFCASRPLSQALCAEAGNSAI
jgi:hypothetical protein